MSGPGGRRRFGPGAARRLLIRRALPTGAALLSGLAIQAGALLWAGSSGPAAQPARAEAPGRSLMVPPFWITGSQPGSAPFWSGRPLRVVWKRDLGRSVSVDPAQTPSGLAVATTDNKLYLLEVESGRKRWKRGFKEPLETPPVWVPEPAPGAILAGTAGPRPMLRCLDPVSGEERWNLRLKEPVMRMEARGDRIWLLDRAGRLACRRSGSGEILWSREGGGWRGPGFHLGEDRVFLLARSDSLLALDLEGGRTLWSAQVGGRFASPPVLAGGELAVIDVDGRLTRLDPASGKVLGTEVRASGQANPLLALGRSIVSVSDGGVVERDGGEGPGWRTDLETASVCPVVEAGPLLLFTGAAGELRALRADQGTPVWSLQMRGGMRVPPLLGEGIMVVATARGEVYVYTQSE